MLQSHIQRLDKLPRAIAVTERNNEISFKLHCYNVLGIRFYKKILKYLLYVLFISWVYVLYQGIQTRGEAEYLYTDTEQTREFCKWLQKV